MFGGKAKAEAGRVFGRTVVMAARVTGTAAGGEILVSQTVQADLDGAFPLGGVRSLTRVRPRAFRSTRYSSTHVHFHRP
jgi:class 3 adenylate cyclase